MADETHEVPEGQYFGRLYPQSPELQNDSRTMRRRLSGHFADYTVDADALERQALRELGVELINSSMFGINWDHFAQLASIAELLGMVTLIARQLQRVDAVGMPAGEPSQVQSWCNLVSGVFEQERMNYRVDERGGVHPLTDAAFVATTTAVIESLQGPRYRNALRNFEDAARELNSLPQDGKAAIRHVFAAIEGLFKLMFGDRPAQLTAKTIEEHLRPTVAEAYGGGGEAARAAGQIVTGMKAWVDAAHNYRHEPGSEDVAQPPIELALGLVTQGAAYLRWLGTLDRQMIEKDAG